MNDGAHRVDASTIRFTRTFDAPVEKVWEYWVDPAKRSKWFCGGATGNKPGDIFTFAFDNDSLSKSPAPEKYACESKISFDGEILIFDAPRHLAFSWPDEPKGQFTRVDVELEEKDGGTLLVLTHSRLPGPDYRIGVSAGWHAHFDLLDDLLSGRPIRDFWGRHMDLEDQYRAVEEA